METEWLIVAGLGGLFVIIGVVVILLGRSEERAYYTAISGRPDVREFLEHRPEVPQPQSLKIGGLICIAVGLLTIAIGGAFWLWG